MSFLGDVWDAITSVASSIFGAGGAVSSITSGISLSSISSLFSGATTIFSTIDDAVKGLTDTIGTFIQPITDVVDSVATLGKDIENDVVAPILTPIATTITTIQGLTTTIDKLVDQGLSGLTQIPGAIANALTGIQTSWDTSTRELADANAKVASETLVPGITAAVAPGLKDITNTMITYAQPAGLQVDKISAVELSETSDLDFYKTKLSTFLATINNPQGFAQNIAAIAYDFASLLPFILGSLASIGEDATAAAKALNPKAVLDIGTVLQLFNKGILDETTSRNELQHSGIDSTRQDALLQSVDFIPDLDRIVGWYLRGIIDADQLAKVCAANGADATDVAALLSAANALVSPQVLLDWLARGFMTQQEFDDQLKAQGYSTEQITQVIKGGVAPAQINTLIAAKANLYAADNNWFVTTYGSTVPPDIANQANALRIDATEASATWTAHWAAMPIQMAINLFFRGQMSRQEVQYVVGQNNFPPDMVDLFIASQTEMIAPRTVPTLLARGSITEAQARADLAARGYSDGDITLLIDDALAQAAAKQKAPPAPTTHLSLSEISQAHVDGIIDDTEYATLLGEHGYSADEISITTALSNYNIAKQTQKDMIATLKAEVTLGTKTIADAQQALTQAGLPTAQIERAVATFRAAKTQAAKMPSYAQMESMAKKSIIDQPTFLAGIQALGYVAPWDQRLAELVFTPGVTDGGSAAS